MKNNLSFINKSDGAGTYVPVGGVLGKILEAFRQFRY